MNEGKFIKTNRIPVSVRVCIDAGGIDVNFACPLCEERTPLRGPVAEADGKPWYVLVCEEHGCFLPKFLSEDHAKGSLDEFARTLIRKYKLPAMGECWVRIIEQEGDPWAQGVPVN